MFPSSVLGKYKYMVSLQRGITSDDSPLICVWVCQVEITHAMELLANDRDLGHEAIRALLIDMRPFSRLPFFGRQTLPLQPV